MTYDAFLWKTIFADGIPYPHAHTPTPTLREDIFSTPSLVREPLPSSLHIIPQGGGVSKLVGKKLMFISLQISVVWNYFTLQLVP